VAQGSGPEHRHRDLAGNGEGNPGVTAPPPSFPRAHIALYSEPNGGG